MDPVTNKILQGVPYAGMGSTLERNALIGVIRNLISQDRYNVDYILNYAESVGYQRQMAEDVFKELTGLSPKLIVNNNAYFDMPSYVPNMCIAWGISKSNKEKAFYIVPFEYGFAVMEKDEVNAPIPTVISATIPEAFDELKKVAKNIQTLDKIITKKLLETEEVPTDAQDVHQVNLPYAASPLQVLKKNFKDKVLSVSEFERQASKLLASEEITVDEAEDLMAWKQDLIDEDETYGNDVLELDEQWKPVGAEDIDENDPDYENRVKEAFTQLSGMIEELDIFKDYAKRSGKDRLFDAYIQLAHEVADEWDIKPEALLGEMTLENPKLVKRIEDQDVENFNQEVKNWTKSQEKFPWKGGSKKKANEEDLDSFDYTYSLLVNGNIDLYKERLNKMSKAKLMDYIAWAEEMGIGREELKLHYITASKKQSGIVPTEEITLADGRTFTVRYNPNEKSITTILDENGREIGVDVGTRLQLLRKLFHKGEPTIVNKSASKKVKSNIKKDSNFEKALSYVEERISNDNNNENDSYPLAFEEAENLFGVDADELQEEYDRRTMTWRNASKKVKSNNKDIIVIDTGSGYLQVFENGDAYDYGGYSVGEQLYEFSINDEDRRNGKATLDVDDLLNNKFYGIIFKDFDKLEWFVQNIKDSNSKEEIKRLLTKEAKTIYSSKKVTAEYNDGDLVLLEDGREAIIKGKSFGAGGVQTADYYDVIINDDSEYQTEVHKSEIIKKIASKKVTAENLVDNKFYLEMNNLDKEQDSELLNALQKFYDIVGFVPPLWDKDIDWYLLSHNLQIAYEKNGGSISNFKGYTSADNKLLTKELLQSLYPNNSSELINLLSDIEDITPSGKVLRKYDDLDSIRFKSRASKKVTAENMTLDDIEEEDNKDQVQEEIEKIDETPAEDIFTETTPEQYFDKALQEDKVDTINDVVSKCIDKFSEKFKDFDKYQVKILSYNTKVLGDDKPVQEEMVEDKELNANAILQVILQITNNAEEANIKKVLAVFSITNGELHWTGTVRGENDQVVAFTEEGLDALFEVNEHSEEELEDII